MTKESSSEGDQDSSSKIADAKRWLISIRGKKDLIVIMYNSARIGTRRPRAARLCGKTNRPWHCWRQLRGEPTRALLGT